MQNILLVEDDHELNQALCYALEKENYRVMSSFSMEEAEKHYSGNSVWRPAAEGGGCQGNCF